MYDHVIIISLDTLRSDAIASTPEKNWPEKYPSARQPWTEPLDQIAAEGTFFPNCLSAAPYTSASHASYFTGKFPLRHGVYEFFNRKLASPTIFTYARRHGYRTRFKTDFPIILGPFLGFDADIDEYIVEDEDEWLSRIGTCRQRSLDFVHFGGIHIPYGFHNLNFGKSDYMEKVAALERELEIDANVSLADQLVETYRGEEDLKLLLRYKRVVQHCYHGRAYSRLFGLYLEGIEYFLRHRFLPFWNRLRDTLAKSRVLVVIFGDHGEEYDEYSYGHFNSVADGVLRVPLIFWGSDVPGRQCSTTVRSVDVFRTLADLTGLPVDPDPAVQGFSLADTLRGGSAPCTGSSIAQAYVSNTAEFLQYQRALLDGRQTSGGLDHVLHGEVVYDRDIRLVRRYYTWKLGDVFREMAPRLELQRRGADGDWIGFRNDDAESGLLRILDSYNASRTVGSQALEVPERVRQELINMGYDL
jgi:choline-sulfatase